MQHFKLRRALSIVTDTSPRASRLVAIDGKIWRAESFCWVSYPDKIELRLSSFYHESFERIRRSKVLKSDDYIPNFIGNR